MDHIKSRIPLSLAPNVYQQRVGQTLTPLIQGKIQYGKLLKKHNIEQVRCELIKRGEGEKFDERTKWTALIKLLKRHEKDNKYFMPLTNYDAFMWNSLHFENVDQEVA